MKKWIVPLLVVAAVCGCKSATRLSITPQERETSFVIRHSQTRTQALNNVELALAQIYNNLPAVLMLRQPETGTFVLKPLVSYQVGGALGPEQHARYTLKIVVSQDSVTLNFELGTEVSDGTWAPETEVRKIKADFRGIASDLAKAVGGTLE